MTAAGRRSRERGTTLVELMVSMTVLLIVVTGFAGVVRYAATANAVAHRRTTTTALRAALIDRVAVTPRAGLAGVVAANAWVVDSCWDVAGAVLGTNPTASATYVCPAGTIYRSWLSATAGAGGASWSVHTYVERTDPGCAAADRYASVACSAADLMLTD